MTDGLDASLADPTRSQGFALRVACLIASLIAAWPALYLLSYIWLSSDYLAHGYLIPLTSLGLLWLRRERIREELASAETPAPGPFVVLAAALFQSGALLAEAGTFAGIGLVATIAATVYAVGGQRLLRALALELRHSASHPQWLEAALQSLNYAVGSQREDGAFPVYFD